MCPLQSLSLTVPAPGPRAAWQHLLAGAPAAIARFPLLHHLSLSLPCCPASPGGPAVELLRVARTLCSSELRGLYLPTGDMHAFTTGHWQQCHVTRLALTDVSGSPGGLQRLCDGLRHCVRLESIDLAAAAIVTRGGHVQLAQDAAGAIAERLAKLPRLRWQRVRGWRLPPARSPRSAASAWATVWHSDLAELSLANMDLDDCWAVQLSCQVRRMRRLEVLDLRGNALTAIGVREIAGALRNTTALRELRFAGSFLDEDCVLELAAGLRDIESPPSVTSATSPRAAVSAAHACTSPLAVDSSRAASVFSGLADVYAGAGAAPVPPAPVRVAVPVACSGGPLATCPSVGSSFSSSTPQHMHANSPAAVRRAGAQLGGLGHLASEQGSPSGSRGAGGSSGGAGTPAGLEQGHLTVAIAAGQQGAAGGGPRGLRVLDVSGAAVSMEALDAVWAAVADLHALRELQWEELAGVDTGFVGDSAVVPHAADMLCALCTSHPELVVRGGDAWDSV